MTPRHDLLPRVRAGESPARRFSRQRLAEAIRKSLGGKRGGVNRRDREEGGEPCPVRPNRPLDLSGGAAAALEFDD